MVFPVVNLGFVGGVHLEARLIVDDGKRKTESRRAQTRYSCKVFRYVKELY